MLTIKPNTILKAAREAVMGEGVRNPTKTQEVMMEIFEAGVKWATEHLEREDDSKAAKWDALDSKIASFYPDDQAVDDYDDSYDLGDIGQAAAIAFGYM